MFPVPDEVTLRLNVARAVAVEIRDGHATDRERSLANAVLKLAEAVEMLKAEVRGRR